MKLHDCLRTTAFLCLSALLASVSYGATVNEFVFTPTLSKGATSVGFRANVSDPDARLATVQVRLVTANIAEFLARSGESHFRHSAAVTPRILQQILDDNVALDIQSVSIPVASGSQEITTSLSLSTALATDTVALADVVLLDGSAQTLSKRTLAAVTDQTAPFPETPTIAYVATDNSYVVSANVASESDIAEVHFDVRGVAPAILIGASGELEGRPNFLNQRRQIVIPSDTTQTVFSATYDVLNRRATTCCTPW